MSERLEAGRPLFTPPFLHSLENLGNRLITAAELEADYSPADDRSRFVFKEDADQKLALWHLTTGTNGTYEELKLDQRAYGINIRLAECHVGQRMGEKFMVLSRVGRLAVTGSTLTHYHQVGGQDLPINDHPVLLQPNEFQSDNALRYFTDDILSLINRLEIVLPPAEASE